MRSLRSIDTARYAYRQLEEAVLQLLGLTDAERRIAHCLLTGMTYEQVASAVHLSRSTIKGYARSIYARASVESRNEFERFIHHLIDSI